jgi:hypothetical protein
VCAVAIGDLLEDDKSSQSEEKDDPDEDVGEVGRSFVEEAGGIAEEGALELYLNGEDAEVVKDKDADQQCYHCDHPP